MAIFRAYPSTQPVMKASTCPTKYLISVDHLTTSLKLQEVSTGTIMFTAVLLILEAMAYFRFFLVEYVETSSWSYG